MSRDFEAKYFLMGEQKQNSPLARKLLKAAVLAAVYSGGMAFVPDSFVDNGLSDYGRAYAADINFSGQITCYGYSGSRRWNDNLTYAAGANESVTGNIGGDRFIWFWFYGGWTGTWSRTWIRGGTVDIRANKYVMESRANSWGGGGSYTAYAEFNTNNGTAIYSGYENAVLTLTGNMVYMGNNNLGNTWAGSQLSFGGKNVTLTGTSGTSFYYGNANGNTINIIATNGVINGDIRGQSTGRSVTLNISGGTTTLRGGIYDIKSTVNISSGATLKLDDVNGGNSAVAVKYSNVAFNNSGTLKTAGTAINSTTFTNSGLLNMGNGSANTITVGTFTSNDGTLKADIGLPNSAVTGGGDKINVTTSASGTVKLHDGNIFGSLDAFDDTEEVQLVAGSGANTVFFTSAYGIGSDHFLYKMENGSSNGYVKLTKLNDYYSLYSVINNKQNFDDDDFNVAAVTLYTLNDNLVLTADDSKELKYYETTTSSSQSTATGLGTLTGRNGDEFTLDGNGHTLDGGSQSGITVEADSGVLNLKNITLTNFSGDDDIVTNRGTVNIIGNVTMNGSIGGTGGTLNIAAGNKLDMSGSDGSIIGQTAFTNAGTLKMGSGTLGGKLTNTGNLELNGTELDAEINGDGKTVIKASGTSTATTDNVLVSQKDLTIENGAELRISADKLVITNAVENKGKLLFTGGNIASDIGTTTEGGMEIQGDVTNTDNKIIKLESLTVVNSGSFTTALENLTVSYANIINKGILNLSSAATVNLTNNITNDSDAIGTLRITAGDITNTDNKTITQNSLEIVKGSSLTTEVDVLAVGAITNNGTLILTADGENLDTLEETVTGSGGTLTVGTGNTMKATGTISQSTVNVTGADLDMDNSLTAGTINIASGKTLFIGADNLKGDVENSGTVKFDGDGTLGSGYTITGGTIDVSANVAADANDIKGAATVQSGYTLTLNNGTLTEVITNNGTVDLTGVTGLTAAVTGGTLNIKQNLQTNADNIKGITNNVEIGKTLTLDSGTLAEEITNNGTVDLTGVTGLTVAVTGGTLNIKQDLQTNAENIKGVTNTVQSGKTLTLSGGTLANAITNSGTVTLTGVAALSTVVTGGTLNVNQDLTTSAGYIKGDVNTITNGHTLTFVGGTLGKTISGEGDVVIDGAVTANASHFANVGTLDVNGGDKLILDGGTLGKNVGNTGTTQLIGDVTVSEDIGITGTLAGNGQTLNMAGTGGGSSINTLTVGTLTGTTNFVLDMDMSVQGNAQSDKIIATTVDNATINISSINIVKDFVAPSSGIALPMDTAEEIQYLTCGSSSGSNHYSVTGGTLTVATNNYTYKFINGDTDGSLKWVLLAEGIHSVKEYIEGTIPGYLGTEPDPSNLSLTDDITYNGTTPEELTADETNTNQTNNELYIHLNGHAITTEGAGIMTIKTGDRKLNIDGGTGTAGNMDTHFIVGTGGTLAVSGNINLTGNIDNTGIVTFAGTTNISGTLGGAGSYINSGTMNVKDAGKLAMSGTEGLANTGTLNLGSATSSALGADITGTGTTNINGTVTNTNKKIMQGALIVNASTGNLTTEVDTLVVSTGITNNGTLNLIADGTSPDTLEEAVGGTGNLNFGGDKKITAGGTVSQTTVNVNTNVDMNNTLTAGTVTIGTGKTLTMGTGKDLTAAITNNGEIVADAGNIKGNVANTGTVELRAGAGTATLGDYTITGGSIKIAGAVTANADNLASTGGITNNTAGQILTLNGGNIQDDITGIGTLAISGTVTNEGKKTITQKIINITGSLTTEVDTLVADTGITNTGTLDLTADGSTDTLQETVTGDGILNFNGSNKITATGAVTQTTVNMNTDVDMNNTLTAGTITIETGKTLTIGASDLVGTVTNSGTVALGSGTLASGSTITGGNIKIAGAVTANANNLASTGGITNDGQILTLNGGDIKDDIAGTGTLAIAGTVTNEGNKTITQGKLIVNETTGNLTTEVDTLVVSTGITNNGTLNLTADGTTPDTLEEAVSGTGTLNFDGDKKITASGTVSQTAVNVNTNVDMNNTLTAGKIVIETGKTLIMGTGKDLTAAITNNGKIVADAGNLKGNVANTGTVELRAGTLGDYTITGGSITITGAVTANANNLASTEGIANNTAGQVLTLNDGDIRDAITGTGTLAITGTVTNTENKGITQNGLTIDSTGELTTEVDTLKINNNAGTITNNGILNLTADETSSDTLEEAVGGTGALNFGGDKKITASGTVSQTTVNVNTDVDMNNTLTAETITIVSGKTLSIGANNLKGDVENGGTLILGGGSLTKSVTNSGTVKFDGATGMNGAIIGGILQFASGNVTVDDAAHIAGNTNTIDSGASVIVNSGTLTKDITNYGSVTMNAGTSFGVGVKINDGDVTLNENVNFTVANLANTGTLTANNAIYNFNADMGTTPSVDQISVTTKATGPLKLGSVAVTDKDDLWYVGTTKQVEYLDGGTGNDIILTSTITVTSDGKKYTFGQGYETDGTTAKIGWMDIKKDEGYKLYEIIQNHEDTPADPSFSPGTVNTYTLIEDYTETNDLGTLTRTVPETPRTFTIAGNNHKFLGNGFAGITVNSGDTLQFSNIGEISGWKDGIAVNNSGTVNFGGDVTLNDKLVGEGVYANNGNLRVEDASKLQMTNGLINSGTLNLGSATASELGANVTGSGTIKIIGTVTSAKNVANAVTVETDGNFTNSGNLTGASVTDNGTMTNTGTVSGPLTNAGTFTNSGTLSGTVTNSGNMTTTFAGIKDIAGSDGAGVTNSGSLKVTGGGALSGQTITNTGGSIDLKGEYTVNGADLIASGNYALAVDGGTLSTVSSTLAITGLTKDNRGDSVNLVNFQNGAAATDGWASLNGTFTDKDSTGIYAPGLKKFTIVSGVLTVNGFGPNFVPGGETDGIQTSACDVADAMSESTDNNITKFIDALSDLQSSGGTKAASDAINAAMNAGEAGGVQHGAVSVVGFIGEAIGSNMSIMSRPIKANPQATMQKTAADDMKVRDAKIEEVPVAKASELMPVAYKAPKYEKTVWASYMHNKETINGLQLDGVQLNGTAQYNGTTVGLDMWSSGKVIGGVALAYTDGKVNSNIGSAGTKNEGDYYGLSVYNRWTNGKNGILADIGYMYAKNELTQRNAGSEITGDAKIYSITAGVRVEQLIKMGKSNLAPFAGVRFMHNKNNEYTMAFNGSSGTHYAPDDQNIISPQVGLAWNGEFVMPGSKWTFRPSVEGGYVWNLGDRDTESRVSFGGASNTIGYDVADKGSYYAQLGMEFMKDNVTLGITYKYQKGDAITNKKWNFNVIFRF